MVECERCGPRTWLLCCARPAHLLVIALLLRLALLLCRLLGQLLLLLVLALSSIPGEGLFKNFEDLLILNVLVSLVLGQVQWRGATQLGDAVLRDRCSSVSAFLGGTMARVR